MKILPLKILIAFNHILAAVLFISSGCNGGGAIDNTGYGTGPGGQSPSAAAKKGRFTIVLAQFVEYDREQKAQRLQGRAKQLLNSDDVWFEFDQLRLSVNYGHFQKHKDAQKELQRTRKLYPQLGLGPKNLQFCYLKEIPQPDPPAPKDWHIFDSGCAYTLEMAVFFNIPDKNYFNRKTDAVEAVKNLRAEGKQAYYLHGPQASWVYVECLAPTIFRRTEINGKIVSSLDPLVNALFKKYQYHENGQRVFDVGRDKSGKRFRVPRKPKFIDVNKLFLEAGY
jgi:hypothetical protein